MKKILHALKPYIAPRSFNRYVLVGILNTSVTFLSFPCFYFLFGTMDVNAILLLSCAFNVCFAFVSHRIVTFVSHAPMLREILYFFSIQCCLTALNLVLFKYVSHATGLHPLLVQFLLVATFFSVNYFFLKKYVFPDPGTP